MVMWVTLKFRKNSKKTTTPEETSCLSHWTYIHSTLHYIVDLKKAHTSSHIEWHSHCKHIYKGMLAKMLQ